jgi:hypothetical protein
VAATLEPGEAQGRPILASPALGVERAAERLGQRPNGQRPNGQRPAGRA